MTDTGTFIINGTERVVVSQLHRSPGRLLRPRQGQDALQRQAPLLARASSRTAARGSTSSSTRRTSSTSASTGAGRCTPRCSCARSATRTQDLLNYFYSTETIFLEKGGKYAKSVEYELLAGQRATRDIKVGSEVIVKKNTKFTKRRHPQDEGGRSSSASRSSSRSCIGKVAAHDVVDPETGEVVARVQRGAHRGQARAPPRGEHRAASRCSSSTASTSAATSATRCSPTR